MNCERANELTADFLGEELSDRDAEAFRLHLEGCAECRGRVARLAEAEAALRALAGSESEADRDISGLRLATDVSSRRRGSHHIGRPIAVGRVGHWHALRLAAMLAIAFVLGYFTKGNIPHPPAPNPALTATVQSPQAARIDESYAAAARRFPSQSPLTWGLLSLARR